jgi:hypothetical protein
MIGSIDSPIVVDSLRNEINFLNNLVTKDGDYILYHRLGSTQQNGKVLDHYEAMDCSGKRYELYIDSYGDKIVAIPPDGFLFDSDCFGCIISDFFDGDDDDIDETYIYKRPGDRERRPIDRYIYESYGVNGKVDFPEYVIDKMIEEGVVFCFEETQKEKAKKIILEHFK